MSTTVRYLGEMSWLITLSGLFFTYTAPEGNVKFIKMYVVIITHRHWIHNDFLNVLILIQDVHNNMSLK